MLAIFQNFTKTSVSHPVFAAQTRLFFKIDDRCVGHRTLEGICVIRIERRVMRAKVCHLMLAIFQNFTKTSVSHPLFAAQIDDRCVGHRTLEGICAIWIERGVTLAKVRHLSFSV